MMISLGDLGKRAGRAENVAPMLKKVRLTVERSVYRQHASTDSMAAAYSPPFTG